MPKKQHLYLSLGGKKFKYLPNSRTLYHGYCSGPGAKKRVIAIGAKCKNKPKLKLDTEIHEMLHALAPWADEHWVNNTAYDIAESLWQLGYRKTIPDGENTQAPQEGG